MKDLLARLTKNTISICFKSGDIIKGAVIEGILGNQIVVNHEGKIALIEISHIGYISTEGETMDVMRNLLNNGESTQEENQNSNQNSNQESNERGKSDNSKESNEKEKSNNNKDNSEKGKADNEKGKSNNNKNEKDSGSLFRY